MERNEGVGAGGGGTHRHRLTHGETGLVTVWELVEGASRDQKSGE